MLNYKINNKTGFQGFQATCAFKNNPRAGDARRHRSRIIFNWILWSLKKRKGIDFNRSRWYNKQDMNGQPAQFSS